MAAQRVFLGWDAPPLKTAVGYLRAQFQRERQWPLDQLVIVVPGRRAGRRLLELLVLEAERLGCELLPPQITTEGKLPELLYAPRHPFADSLTQDLAWARALQSLPEQQLRAVVPHPPERTDVRAWRTLGELMRVRHAELASHCLQFADVVRRGGELPDFPDAARWGAMATAQEAYWRLLDSLLLWDIQTARLEAIKRKEIRFERPIFLLGTVDLTPTLRHMLTPLGKLVTALIAAPESEQQSFDDLGCLVAEQWQERIIPLAKGQVTRVDAAADQADAVARWLADLGGRYRADEITIGVLDEQLAPHLERQMKQCAAPVRWVLGRALGETPPCKLLAAVAEYLAGASAASFAALVRHPDLYAWLARRRGVSLNNYTLLLELDRLLSEHLIARMQPTAWPYLVRDRIEKQADFCEVAFALNEITRWLAELRDTKRELSRWSAVMVQLLKPIYGDDASIVPRETAHALEALRDYFAVQAEIPASLDPMLPATSAIRIALQQCQKEAVPAEPNEEAIEMLGWLELPLDDAPALVITTFNEGYVPSTTSADSFLPNNLRRCLELPDANRRYARDAYFLTLIAHTRPDCRIVCARRNALGEPLIPSRFLFAVDTEEIVRRAQYFFAPGGEAVERLPLVGWNVPLPESSGLLVPHPVAAGKKFERLLVTQFRDYLACPYRFYLKHVLQLRRLHDDAPELDGRAFGNLMHAVLEAFGRDPNVREERDEQKLSLFLLEQFDKLASRMYGQSDRLPAVELQFEQLRLRLKAFATWQTERTRAGWRIVYSEETADDEAEPKKPRPNTLDAPFEVDGATLALGGRIDRIDQHLGTGELAILDYKTSDTAKGPQAAHRAKGEWIDLQLPLYRHLAAAWGHEANVVRLGYILLPSDLKKIGDDIADWSADELADADETARQVVRGVWGEQFWPPSDVPGYDDEFTALCQDHAQGGRNLGDSP